MPDRLACEKAPRQEPHGGLKAVNQEKVGDEASLAAGILKIC